MKKTTRVAMAASLAGCIAAVVPVSSASAYDLYDQSVSNCKTGVTGWGPNGSFAMIQITDQGSHPNFYTVRQTRSRSYGQLLGCYNGYRTTSGEKKITTSWKVKGSRITDCNLGMNLGCNISLDKTTASETYTQGWAANGNGFYDVDASFGDVYANPSTGDISSYSHSASISFRKNGVTVVAGQTNAVFW